MEPSQSTPEVKVNSRKMPLSENQKACRKNAFHSCGFLRICLPQERRKGTSYGGFCGKHRKNPHASCGGLSSSVGGRLPLLDSFLRLAFTEKQKGTPMSSTEQKIKASGDDIVAAARMLIGMVRVAERGEEARSSGATLELQVELTSGGVETWTITIERKASSH